MRWERLTGASTGPITTTETATTPHLAPEAIRVQPERATNASDGGDWPHTTRIMPWLIAAFIGMLFLVPFDAVNLQVSLPVDSKLDRFALAALALVWVTLLLTRAPSGPRFRRSPMDFAIATFLAIALLGVVTNYRILDGTEEGSLAVKKLSLLISFVLLFYIIATSIRATELRAFGALIAMLGAITAFGAMIEFRTGHNYFFELTARVLPTAPEAPDPKYGRRNVTGPTSHGLAVSLIIAMALPFALSGLLQARETRRQILFAGATGVILLGGLATVRKTGTVAPIVSLVVFTAYRPREMLRLAPLGLIVVAASVTASPGALTGLRFEFNNTSGDSTTGRTDDYDAVQPDLLAHPALGRGYGTYDPKVQRTKVRDRRRHRFLDNEYLLLAIEIGVLGLAAYALIFVSGLLLAHRLARERFDQMRSGPALAAVGAVAVFAIGNALFDVLAFPQAPYIFFVVLALAVVAARDRPGSGGAGIRLSARPAAASVIDPASVVGGRSDGRCQDSPRHPGHRRDHPRHRGHAQSGTP